MPDLFYFPIYAGLLSEEHRERIGPALWEFLWCISKTTKEEGTTGTVLGGKPIGYQEVAKELGGSKSTVKRNFERLEKEKYISLKRTPYGHIIYVHNSKKFLKSAKNDTGAEYGTGAKNDQGGAIFGRGGAKYGHSNKDREVDKELDINTTTTTARDNSLDGDGTPETVMKEVSPYQVELINHYLRLNSQMHHDAKDVGAAKEIEQAQVPLKQAKEWVSACFEDFNRRRKHKRQRIHNLEYCVGFVLDKQFEEKEGDADAKHSRGSPRPSFTRTAGKSAADVERQKEAARRAWG
ncbi:hypothetical protein MUN89_15830 [Halobacillus salinarum]|uniref:Uncharacterized protein n=1 Tax=Halobacillus salinarum TaxID=2932257 RepID=A0ABY4EID2_9BACI|nr:hypothetical protein [Halobacillus salinarum]UOQ43379.1 hypothetical protein MUN89_15830 [Halobacillus salinarum]